MSKIQANQIQHTQNGAAVFTLPTSDGSANQVIKTDGSGALSFVTSTDTVGLQQIDQWTVTSDFAGSVDPIQNNLARFTNGGSYLGSGMTVSSGIWTFPTTGFWLILFTARSSRVDAGHQSRYQFVKIAATTDNNFSSTDETLALGETGFYDNYSANYRYNGAYCSAVFDVTNTSTHKIKFETSVEDNSNNGISWGQMYMQFIKIGET